MDELQRILRAVLGFTRKRGSAVLGDDARVAELADVAYHRQPTRHVVLGQLSECVEVEVAVPLVLAPSFIVLARGETERRGRLDVEDVEPVGAAANLDEQPLVLIPDPQDSVINHHLGSSLI